MSIDYKKEMDIAKKAALEAGKYLRNNKIKLNQALSSTNRDLKLKADIEAEKMNLKTFHFLLPIYQY